MTDLTAKSRVACMAAEAERDRLSAELAAANAPRRWTLTCCFPPIRVCSFCIGFWIRAGLPLGLRQQIKSPKGSRLRTRKCRDVRRCAPPLPSPAQRNRND